MKKQTALLATLGLVVTGLLAVSAAPAIAATRSRMVAISPYSSVIALVSPQTDGNPLYRTTNGGSAWVRVTSALGDPGSIFVAAFAPKKQGLVYLGTGTGIFKSTNDGSSWRKLSAHVVNISAMAVSASNSNIVYAGTVSAGVVRTTNGGSSWAARNSGLPRAGSLNVNGIVVDPGNANKAVLLGSSLAYRTTNGGSTWTKIHTWSSCIPQGNDLVGVGSGLTHMYAGTCQGIYRSVNGGSSWSSASTGLSQNAKMGGLYWLAVDPAHPTHVFAAAVDGVYYTSNAGSRWYRRNTGLPSGSVNSLAWSVANPKVVFASTNSGVYRSVDTGLHWALRSSGLP